MLNGERDAFYAAQDRHTCIRDDGGTALRRCHACEEENARARRASHGRKGEEHWHAKVTEREVRAIRALRQDWGMSIQDLAKAFNLSTSTVASIVYRRRWKHLQ